MLKQTSGKNINIQFNRASILFIRVSKLTLRNDVAAAFMLS